MNRVLNLRRNPKLSVLLGILIALIGVLILIVPERVPAQLIYGSLLLAGGILTAASVNRLIIDKKARVLIHQRGFLIACTRKRYPLGQVKAVDVATKLIRDGEDSKSLYTVSLSGERDAVVAKHGNPWFARVLAEQLARCLHVPMNNRIYDVATQRKPDELDTPLMKRWSDEHVQFDKPGLPVKTRLRERADEGSYVLSFPAQFPGMKYLVIFLFVLVIPVTIAIPEANFYGSAFYSLVALIAITAGVTILSFTGRSKLSIDSRQVAFRQGYFPVSSRMRLEEIEELIVASDGITLIGDERAVWIQCGGSKRDSAYLEAVVPYQLERLARHGRMSL
jgi:hypothetical protein